MQLTSDKFVNDKCVYDFNYMCKRWRTSENNPNVENVHCDICRSVTVLEEYMRFTLEILTKGG